LDNPDTGRVEYLFTVGGELGAKETPNLRDRGEMIRYQRFFHRLQSIETPDDTDVVFSYGPPGAAHGGAGRVTRREDESGSTEYRYDSLGQVTQSTQMLQGVGSIADTTVVIGTEHDAFGRLLSRTYPDGEVVSYSYDRGGSLERVQGVRGATQTTYVAEIRYL
jgi:YD repeat-containing protein